MPCIDVLALTIPSPSLPAQKPPDQHHIPHTSPARSAAPHPARLPDHPPAQHLSQDLIAYAEREEARRAQQAPPKRVPFAGLASMAGTETASSDTWTLPPRLSGVAPAGNYPHAHESGRAGPQGPAWSAASGMFQSSCKPGETAVGGAAAAGTGAGVGGSLVSGGLMWALGCEGWVSR